MRRGPYGPRTIPVILRNRRFEVDMEVLLTYLPCAGRRLREPILDFSYLQGREGRLNEKALTYIFEYLEEISHYNISNALIHSLERLWEKHHRHAKAYGGPGYKTLGELFHQMCEVLNPKSLGCNVEIAGILSDYLTRHCDDIMRSDPLVAFSMVVSLQYLQAPTNNALTFIMQHKNGGWKLVQELRRLQQIYGPNTVSSEAIANLEVLASLDEQRLVQMRDGRHFPSARLQDAVGMVPRLIRADDLHRSQVQEMLERRPDRVLVQMSGTLGDMNENGRFDPDDDYSSEDEEDYRLARPHRRTFPGRMPLDAGLRRPRGLEDGLMPRRMGGKRIPYYV